MVSGFRYLRRTNNRILLIIVAVGLIHFAFYTLYLPAFWFFTRYFYFIYAVMVILFSLFYFHKDQEFGSDPSKGTSHKILQSSVVIVLLANMAVLASFVGGMQPSLNDRVIGVKSYKPAAEAVLANVPENVVLGAFQSGALSYFPTRGARALCTTSASSGFTGRLTS